MIAIIERLELVGKRVRCWHRTAGPELMAGQVFLATQQVLGIRMDRGSQAFVDVSAIDVLEIVDEETLEKQKAEAEAIVEMCIASARSRAGLPPEREAAG